MAPEFPGRARVALALCALAPAAFLPFALNRFVFAKVAVVAVAVALAATVAPRGRLPRPVVALVAAAFALLAAAALASPAPIAALLGRAPRYEGAFVVPLYAAAAFAGAWLLGPERSRRALPFWLRWLTVAAVAVALEAVLEAFGLRPLATDVARPGSLLGNASDEGAYAVLCLGPLAAAAVAVRDRWCAVGAVASAVTLVLSGSRGALVGAVVVVGVLVWLSPARAVRLALAGLGLALVAAGFAVPATRARVVASSPLAASTVRGRVLLWEESVRLVAAHLAVGVGPSGFVDAVPAEHDLAWAREVGPANPPDSPHDWPLQVLAAGGVLLLLVVVALAAATFSRGLRAARAQTTPGERAAVAGLVAGLAGYGTALLFHFTSPGTTPLAAVFAGVLLATAPAGDTGRWRRWGRLATAVVAGLLAVVLSAAALAEVPLKQAIVQVAGGDVTAADADFHAAQRLRPWDDEIAATAAHAFAVAAADGVPGAAAAGRPWALEALGAFPDSVQALDDLATVDELTGRLSTAGRLLDRAEVLDPYDADVVVHRGVVAAERGDDQGAVALFERAAFLAPSNPAPLSDLAAAERAEGRPRAAARAEERARRLGG